MTPQIAVMVAPQAAFSRLLADRGTGWLGALRRVTIVALVVGTSIAISATSRVSFGLVLSVTAWWSFTVVVQLAAAVLLIASAPGRRVDFGSSVDLFFVGHAPWSLWLMLNAIPGLTRLLSIEGVLLSALVPYLWTNAIVFAFCRRVLNDDRRRAFRRTAVHQGFILVCFVTCVVLAVDLWPRLAASFAR